MFSVVCWGMSFSGGGGLTGYHICSLQLPIQATWQRQTHTQSARQCGLSTSESRHALPDACACSCLQISNTLSPALHALRTHTTLLLCTSSCTHPLAAHTGQNNQNKQAVAVVSNHCGWVDILIHMARYFPAFVARDGTQNLPMVGLIRCAVQYLQWACGWWCWGCACCAVWRAQ